MRYEGVEKGIFINRPNRFVAEVSLNGRKETVHVKNTGRCAELLLPGVEVYLQNCGSETRKTKYDLIAVERDLGDGERLLINMDSQAPNRVAEEGLRSGRICLLGTEGKALSLIRRERTFGDSRFDLYLEYEDGVSAFVEVKGVTLLEEDGIARFPDAPTERGVKHLKELCRVKEAGLLAGLIFIVQMKRVLRVEPNERTHPAFGQAMRDARAQGVSLQAYDCIVKRDSLEADCPVEVVL